MNDEIDPRLQYYATQQNQDLIRFQLDNSMVLDDLKADILGKEWNDELNTYVDVPYKQKLINEIGANAIMSFLKPRVTKIISLSKLSEDDIRTRCKNYMDSLSFMLVVNRDEYDLGIKFQEKCDSVIELCDDVVFSTAMKGIDGWEGDGIRKQHQTVESKETINDNRKPVTTPFALPFGGNK